jgi:hypothetical protein
MAHEPLHKETIVYLLEWRNGKYSDEEMKKIIEFRDWRLGLEAESSHFMHYFVSIIKDIFSDVRFIMTVREPLGWIESEFSQNMVTRSFKHWKMLEEFRYGRYENEYCNEKIKKSKNLYPIKSYLDYWVDHTYHVDEVLKNERYLKMSTYDINEKIGEIEDISEVRIEDKRTVHSNRGDKNKKIYEYVEKGDLIAKIKEHKCMDVISKKFDFIKEDMEYVI